MRQDLKSWLVGFFCLMLVGSLVVFNIKKPRILIIHPFSADHPGTKTADHGIKRFLLNNHRPINVEWHYLNLQERLPHNIARNGLKQALRNLDPDLVMAFDDEGNEIAADLLKDKPTPKLLYVSIDKLPEEFGYSAKNQISGIVEDLPMSAVAKLLSEIDPSKGSRIAVLGTKNYTSQPEWQQVLSFNWSPHRIVESRIVKDRASLQEYVHGLNGQADLLLILNFEGLEQSQKGSVSNYQETVAWIEEHSPIFPMALRTSYVDMGGGFAIGPPREDYGFMAMEMAVDWLDERDNKDIPAARHSQHYNIAMRETVLKRRSIRVPEIYREAARMGGSEYP